VGIIAENQVDLGESMKQITYLLDVDEGKGHGY
jgi:hypothetical protein